MEKQRLEPRITGSIALLFLLLLISSACVKKPNESTLHTPGVYDVSIKVDTMTRWFKAIIPPNYDHSNKHPLLLAFHGGNLSMGYMLNNREDLIQRCEDENWILVFPNGADFDDNRGAAAWNAIHCCNPVRQHNVDDIGFIRKIVDTLSVELNIDAGRIYAIGGSNGGMLIHRIAVELPDIFAAVAENQGTAGGIPSDSSGTRIVANPSRPIPILLIHGMDDSNVRFYGGYSSGNPKRYDISFDESVSIWVNNNGCKTEADTSIVNGLNGRVFILDYKECTDNAAVRAIVIENKGHGWPSLEKSGFDGTNASVDFLKEYSK